MMTYLLAIFLAGGLLGGDAKPTPAAVSASNEQLEQAARNFRIQVYNTYRLDRPEYDRRIAAWIELEGAWHVAGAPTEEQPKLIHWLETSLAQSQPETKGPLPELPQIVAAEPPAARPTVDAKPVVDAQPVADAKPKFEATPTGDVKPAAEAQPADEPQPPVDAEPAVVPQPSADSKPAAEAEPPVKSKPADEAKPEASAAQPQPVQPKDDAANQPTAVEQPVAAEKPAPVAESAPNSAAKKPVDVPWLHSLGKQLGEDLNDAAGAFLPKP